MANGIRSKDGGFVEGGDKHITHPLDRATKGIADRFARSVVKLRVVLGVCHACGRYPRQLHPESRVCIDVVRDPFTGTVTDYRRPKACSTRAHRRLMRSWFSRGGLVSRPTTALMLEGETVTPNR